MKQYPNITNIGHYMPDKITIADAISLGFYNNVDHARSQYRSVCIESNLFPADMVIQAANNMNISNDEYDLFTKNVQNIIYCYIHAQGQHEFWSPASYIAKYLQLSNTTSAYSLKQGCNAMMIAIQQACTRLNNNPIKSELIYCGDRFNTSSFNRWSSDYVILYGDGACMVELNYHKPARFSIEYVNTISSWQLEELHRNNNFQSLLQYDAYDVKNCKKQYLQKYGKDTLKNITTEHLQQLSYDLLSSTSFSLQNMDYIILPNLDSDILVKNYINSLNIGNIASSVDWGSTVGHLGCGDCLIGLDILDKQGTFQRNDKILLICAGSGCSWTFIMVTKL